MAEKFLAIAGNIGVGKTSLVRYVSSRFGFEPVYEPFMNNPYLDDFYEDMSGYAFQSQLWFLTHKFRLHSELGDAPGILVQDRTIYEDAEIFAAYLASKGYMADRDYQTYRDLYQVMRNTLQPPDLLIYLRCSVRAIRRRIKRRGRPSEQDIPTRYLRDLNELYEGWMGRYDLSPVLVWDTEKGDYLEDLVDRLEFHQALERLL